VIGAHRGGTTSFFYYLCRHPGVAEALTKEIHFFDANYGRGTGWYRSFFPRGHDRLAGEATPYYLFHPAVPERVRETIPDASFIVLLRNPVDRAYSHYQKVRRQGIERLSFRKALAAEERRLAEETDRLLSDANYRSSHHHRHAYASRGLYAEQLERWFAHFPRDRFLVLKSEDYFMRPAQVYAQALEFLSLPTWLPAGQEARNPASYKPLDPAVRACLEARFAEPNARLERLLGRELWAPSVSSAGSAAQSSAASSTGPAA
jgi:lipopolysaccharide transport system ATP-binding protein